jgi:3-oxoadipate enol-lactonase
MRADLGDHTTEFDDNAGPGQPVVLVHSALLDRHVWDTVTPQLGIRAITYDLRGHGAAAGAPPITGIPQLAADLDRLLDVLGVPAAHLVGLSFGGAIVQELAASRPWRVRSLTLHATACTFPKEPLLQRARSIRELGRDRVVADTLTRWFTSAVESAVRDRVQHLLERIPEPVFEATWTALAGYDAAPAAPAVDRPVLALAAGADLSTPPAMLRRATELYQRAVFAEIDGAPHLAPLERPAEVAAALRTFLAAATSLTLVSTTLS